ncbi:hypothetical protein WJX74_007999 [Apatococcus lobatus]|uniref:Uncharacterized protein n=1 Tax=Apatococcus lobatus TaxID=904363 RepID=A0AAW1RDW5_9CHLO
MEGCQDPRHHAFKSCGALAKNADGLICGRCNLTNNTSRVSGGPSRWERAACKAVEKVSGEPYCVEVRMVCFTHQEYNGLVDIWLPFAGVGSVRVKIKLAIMVDGEHHFNRNNEIFGQPLQKQQAIDERFNNLCEKHSIHLLRLHYRQTRRYAALIRWAIQACLDKAPAKPMYSWKGNARRAWIYGKAK